MNFFLISYGLSLYAPNTSCVSVVSLTWFSRFFGNESITEIFTKRFKLPNPLLLAGETDYLHNVIGNERLFWRKISATRIKRKVHHIRSSAYKAT